MLDIGGQLNTKMCMITINLAKSYKTFMSTFIKWELDFVGPIKPTRIYT
jgi:hypothetical protein